MRKNLHMCIGCQTDYDDDPYMLNEEGELIKTFKELENIFQIITVPIKKCMNHEKNLNNWDAYISGKLEFPQPIKSQKKEEKK